MCDPNQIQYFDDGRYYIVKCKDGKWRRTEKWVTALWAVLSGGGIQCINIAELERTGILIDKNTAFDESTFEI